MAGVYRSTHNFYACLK